MSGKQPTEVASRLSRLHVDAFAGRRAQKLLRITHESFYKIAGLQQLKAAKYREIAEALLEERGLILGRGPDFFTLVVAKDCATWTALTPTAVSQELRRKTLPAPAHQGAETALSPAAAWPFPLGNKP